MADEQPANPEVVSSPFRPDDEVRGLMGQQQTSDAAVGVGSVRHGRKRSNSASGHHALASSDEHEHEVVDGVDVAMDHIANAAGRDGLLPPGKSSVGRSAVNQANTIIGAGMLSFPKALAGCGVGLGTILLLFFACMSVIDQHLLACVARKFGRPSSFKSICDGSGLSQHAWIVDASNVLVSVGACIAYLMVAGDTLARVVSEVSPAWGERSLWIVLSTLFVAPLCCLKRLDALAATSSLAILFVLYIASLVVLTAMGAGHDEACAVVDHGSGGGDDDATVLAVDDYYGSCGGRRSFAVLAPSTVASLPVFTFGYNCQQNVFSTQHNELREPTTARANAVAGYAVGGATVVYVLVSVCGYATFGPGVASDVLDSFATATPAVTAARLGISMVVLFSYPVIMHATRPSAANLVDAVAARVASTRHGKWLLGACRQVLWMDAHGGGRGSSSSGGGGGGGGRDGSGGRRTGSGIDDQDDEHYAFDDRDSIALVSSDSFSSSLSSPHVVASAADAGAREALAKRRISGDGLPTSVLPESSTPDARRGSGSNHAESGDDSNGIAASAEGGGLDDGDAISNGGSSGGAPSEVAVMVAAPSPRVGAAGSGEARLPIVLSMVFSTMVVALCFENLDVVLGLAGATGATMICYIIPGYCYAINFDYPHTMRTAAVAQLVFGLILGPASVVIILLQAAGVL